MFNPIQTLVQNDLGNNNKKQSLYVFSAGAIFILRISLESTDALEDTNRPSCLSLEHLDDVCFLSSGAAQ